MTLVGILDADSGLFSADFRGSERVAQLMTQVSGRAGREENRVKLFLQTYCPDHPQIEEIINGTYQSRAKVVGWKLKNFENSPLFFSAKVYVQKNLLRVL